MWIQKFNVESELYPDEYCSIDCLTGGSSCFMQKLKEQQLKINKTNRNIFIVSLFCFDHTRSLLITY